MASVSAVSSTDFRSNLAQPQNNATEGDDPFSLLLNAVTDLNANVGAQDAPKAAERRDDAPAKAPKPDADTDRQAKKQEKDTDATETKPQAESAAPAKPAKDDSESEDTEDDDGADTANADALLMLALNDSQQQTAISVQVSADASTATPVVVTPAVIVAAQATAEVQTAPALAAAIADVTAAASAETPTQPTQNAAQTKAQFEVATAPVQAEVEAQITTPKITAETIASLLKPLKAASSLDAQAQTQPGSVQIATATPVQGAGPLETLNAAINKHMQLALGADAADQTLDAPKPLLSSNAVAPNFAMTAQVNAPVQAQTRQVAEAARAVPLDQVAVEIATRASKGERRFDIRLDPPELGRIEVKLEIDSKGNTTTKLIVERAETLDMLQRDARGLEKALQNAGLKLDAGGMQFSLQQDAQTQQGHQNHAPDMRNRPDLLQADGEIMTEVSINNASLAAQLRGGVDIRI